MNFTLEQLNATIKRHNLMVMFQAFDEFETTTTKCKCTFDGKDCKRNNSTLYFGRCEHTAAHEKLVKTIGGDIAMPNYRIFYAESLRMENRHRYVVSYTDCSCNPNKGKKNPFPCKHLCLVYMFNPTLAFEKRFGHVPREYIAEMTASASDYKVYTSSRYYPYSMFQITHL